MICRLEVQKQIAQIHQVVEQILDGLRCLVEVYKQIVNDSNPHKLISRKITNPHYFLSLKSAYPHKFFLLYGFLVHLFLATAVSRGFSINNVEP